MAAVCIGSYPAIAISRAVSALLREPDIIPLRS